MAEPATSSRSAVAVALTRKCSFVAGQDDQIPMDADGQLIGADDPEMQIRQVFQNLATTAV
jgi:enamine deaminase RidA (YjgF/YER057c/UK114 family)